MTPDLVDRSRAWIWGGRLLIVAFLATIAVLVIAGVHALLVAAVALAIGMAGSLLLSPERSWWGPAPAAILSDPVRRAAYRTSELRFLIIAFIAIAVVLPLLGGVLSTVSQP